MGYRIHLPREAGETDAQMQRRAKSMVGQRMFAIADIPNATCTAARVTKTTLHKPDPVVETVIEVRFAFEEVEANATC